MEELLATNNIVTISFVETLLEEAGLDFLILDQNMSILEGSIGIIPRRIMVADHHLMQARNLIIDVGLEKELSSKKPV